MELRESNVVSIVFPLVLCLGLAAAAAGCRAHDDAAAQDPETQDPRERLAAPEWKTIQQLQLVPATSAPTVQAPLMLARAAGTTRLVVYVPASANGFEEAAGLAEDLAREGYSLLTLRAPKRDAADATDTGAANAQSAATDDPALRQARLTALLQAGGELPGYGKRSFAVHGEDLQALLDTLAAEPALFAGYRRILLLRPSAAWPDRRELALRFAAGAQAVAAENAAVAETLSGAAAGVDAPRWMLDMIWLAASTGRERGRADALFYALPPSIQNRSVLIHGLRPGFEAGKALELEAAALDRLLLARLNPDWLPAAPAFPGGCARERNGGGFLAVRSFAVNSYVSRKACPLFLRDGLGELYRARAVEDGLCIFQSLNADRRIYCFPASGAVSRRAAWPRAAF